MAKRYFKFEELWQMPEGEFKPGGTLGRHHAEVKRNGGQVTFIGTDSYGKSISITIEAGDTVGYDCGNIWKVKKPTDYNCPLRQRLCELHYSQKIIEFAEGVQICYSRYAGGVVGELIYATEECEQDWHETQKYGDIEEENADIKIGVCCILQESYHRGANDYPKRISRIIINPAKRKQGIKFALANLPVATN